MSRHLVLTVHLHDRFHGMGVDGPEWPPAPARLFSALVAGSARGDALPDETVDALEWLETLPPPVIAAPHARLGMPIALFVPNNDADSLADPTDVGPIRTRKVVHARIPESGALLYAWPISPDQDAHAIRIAEAANDIYQLGRGIDMAWATGEVVDDGALTERLASFGGEVRRPEPFGSEEVLPCPAPGSLESLVRRHKAARLRTEASGRRAKTYFTNAPKPFFVGVSYALAVRRALFELRRAEAPERAMAIRSSQVVALVERIRDAAAARLRAALPQESEAIDRSLIGRKVDGQDAGPIAQRIRIVPLPSIGHAHADRGVRRVVVEIPPGAPLDAADVEWAFTGLSPMDDTTGLLDDRIVLVPANDTNMLGHYSKRSLRWRSVTPLALPERAARRRIEPTRMRSEGKDAAERAKEEALAEAAVRVALRHASVRARVLSVRVQREPLDRNGLRAEASARPPRFPKERLWHVEILLDRHVAGPLVLGDGRFLGLGLMAPSAPIRSGIYAFRVDGAKNAEPIGLARALRRAVMARAQDLLGERPLGRFFSGHEEDGTPAMEGRHLAFQFDPGRERLLVIVPPALGVDERRDLDVLERALDGLTELRAGEAGVLTPRAERVDEDDPLLRPARTWTSLTRYSVTRHVKAASAKAALRADVLHECTRRCLPQPTVRVLAAEGVSRRGLTGLVELTFRRPVRGPIVLGRTRYLGGGLFIGGRS